MTGRCSGLSSAPAASSAGATRYLLLSASAQDAHSGRAERTRHKALQQLLERNEHQTRRVGDALPVLVDRGARTQRFVRLGRTDGKQRAPCATALRLRVRERVIHPELPQGSCERATRLLHERQIEAATLCRPLPVGKGVLVHIAAPTEIFPDQHVLRARVARTLVTVSAAAEFLFHELELDDEHTPLPFGVLDLEQGVAVDAGQPSLISKRFRCGRVFDVNRHDLGEPRNVWRQDISRKVEPAGHAGERAEYVEAKRLARQHVAKRTRPIDTLASCGTSVGSCQCGGVQEVCARFDRHIIQDVPVFAVPDAQVLRSEASCESLGARSEVSAVGVDGAFARRHMGHDRGRRLRHE